MPIPLALIGAGASLLGQGINAGAQAGMNKSQQRWNEKMYNLQRQHALEDRDWEANYNDPSSQMARLKGAGLNPNLVYGNGVTQNAPNIRSSQVSSWNPKAPSFNPSDTLSAYFDTEIKQAQADNLKVQNQKLEDERRYIQAQTILSTQNAIGKDFSNKLSMELRNNTIEAADANLRKIRAEIDNTTTITDIQSQRNRREERMNNAQLQAMADNLKTAAINRLESMSRTSNNYVQNQKMQTEIQAINQGTYNAQIEGDLKELERERQLRGASVSDPWFVKRLDAIMEKFIGKWKN